MGRLCKQKRRPGRQALGGVVALEAADQLRFTADQAAATAFDSAEPVP